MDSQMLILSLSIKVFPSSHAVSALHAADSSDCQMIILFKKKKKKKELHQGNIIAIRVELKLPLFQLSLFWVLLTVDQKWVTFFCLLLLICSVCVCVCK